jgi:hypothetical protein
MMHVGCTLFITFSTGDTMKRHARITLGVEFITSMSFDVFIIVMNTMTSLIKTNVSSSGVIDFIDFQVRTDVFACAGRFVNHERSIGQSKVVCQTRGQIQQRRLSKTAVRVG